MRSNAFLWLLQIGLAAFFIITGVIHFVVPEGLPGPMAWMYDMSRPLHLFSGTVEILAGLGLILPGLLRVMTWLTPLAAAGLVVVMIAAAVWHLGRGEYSNLVTNGVLALAALYVAYARWRIAPLGRSSGPR